MSNILDQFSISPSQFEPKSAAEMFALRLAQKLGEPEAAEHYLSLVDRYSESRLLCAYRRMLRRNGNHDAGRMFHRELEKSAENGYTNGQASLIAVRIERRTVAAAVFTGSHLDYADARQLASTREKAVASTAGFIAWMLHRFDVESAAL